MVFVHLFVKVSRPGDSEVTFSAFESSYNLLLYVVLLKGTGLPLSIFLSHTQPFNFNVKRTIW